MVLDHAADYPSLWAAIRSVGEKPGCSVEALRRWVRQAERDAGQRPGLMTDERQRLSSSNARTSSSKARMRFSQKASAYFAQAELERRWK
jgi:transposase